MLHKISLITPPFLKKFDQQLLLNYPHIWATRIHYVLFAITLYIGFLTLLGSIYPISIASLPEIDLHFALAFVPAIIGALFWIYSLHLFRVEKSFGQTNLAKQITIQMLILMGAIALSVPPYLYAATLTYRIGKLENEKTLLADVEKLDIGYYYFCPYKVQQKEEDSTLYIEDLSGNNIYLNLAGCYTNSTTYFGNHLIAKNNHSIFKTYTTNEYLLSDRHVMLYETYIEKASKSKQLAQIQDFMLLYEKYSGGEIAESAEQVLQRRNQLIKNDEYNLAIYRVQQNIRNIANSHIWNFTPFNAFMMFFNVYAIILAVIALFVLLKTQFKTFIYTVITAIIGMLLGVLAVGISCDVFGGDFKGYSIVYSLAAWLGLIIIGYMKATSPKFKSFQQISVSIAAAMTPFLPYLLYFAEEYYDFRKEYTLVYLGVPFLGIALFAVSWNLFLAKLLKDLQAAPVR